MVFQPITDNGWVLWVFSLDTSLIQPFNTYMVNGSTMSRFYFILTDRASSTGFIRLAHAQFEYLI